MVWMTRVQFLAGTGNSPYHHDQTGSGSHLASYPMHSKGSFTGGKVARAWSWL